MSKPYDETTPFSDALGLVEYVRGIFGDLEALRKKEITIEEARVRAQMAEAGLAGVRVILQGQKFLMANAKLLNDGTGGEA